MAGVDNRVVSIKFDNAQFEAGVAKTLASLQNLNKALQNIGSSSGFSGISKAAQNVNLAPMQAALDELKRRLDALGGTTGFTGVQNAANSVSFGPLGSAIENIKGRFATLTEGPSRALDALKEKLGFRGADAGFANIESAAGKVKLSGANAAADELQKRLQFPGVDKGFDNIERASGRVKLAGIHNAIQSVTQGFTVLQGAAAVALGNIASKAVEAGLKTVKSFSFGPIQQGLEEYATNLNSIQTILANTKFEGANLRDVNRALEELNKYSDQTIYNFSEMAKNIGTFTAAGVNLKDSVASIKGIANLAALSGSNSQKASMAMYQLSQAIASGRVSLQDWNSVVNAGMGGATFQRALATTAQVMGTVAEGAVKIDKATGKATINGESFRESIMAKPGEESWLTSEVLTNTLAQFTGDLSRAELAAQGFSEAQIKAIQETAITAKKAATEVKTISGVFDVVRESIASGWAKTFQNIFGDFEEAKSLFTDLTTYITGIIGKSADARNAMLADWKQLGGRNSVIEGIKNVWEGLLSVLRPIREAFRDIFPRKTGQDLADLSQRFEDFTEKLKIGPETAENLRRTFAGFFAVLNIGKEVIFGILGVFGDLLGAATSGSGGFLNFTGTIGDFLVSVNEAITQGKGLTRFFDGLGMVLSAPIKLLSDFAGALGDLFGSGGAADGASSGIDKMTESLGPLESALDAVERGWEGLLKMLEGIGIKVGPLVDKISSAFTGVADAISNAFSDLDFDHIFEVLQTGLLGGIFVAIKKALGGGINIDLGGGVLSNMSESLSALTGSLKAMQRNVQAGTLLKIGLAVAALAAGITALSLIEPKRLASAMTAVSVGLGQLVAAMALLAKVGGITSFLTMPFIAASMILLAGAINILALAVWQFSRLSWEDLAKGLLGVGAALVAVGLGVRAIPPSVALTAVALLPLAVALNLLALSMKIFATMDWEEMAKGLIGVGGGLTAVGLGLKFIGPSVLLIGPGLVAVAAALNLLAVAVAAFGSMDLLTLGKGVGGIGAALVVLGFAIKTIPPTVALQAAGLILLSVALTGMAGAIALMGTMKIVTIAKGLAAIGAALLVLGVGLKFMSGTIPGAVALMAAATALAVLAPVLGLLGTMKWTTIVKGLAAMAAILAVLAVAGSLAAGPITALGVALSVLAASVVIVGAGVYLLASGLAKLGGEGSKGITAAMVALTAFIAILPKMIIDFLKGLVEVLAAIAKLAPQIVDSMVKIVDSLIEVVIRSAPRMAEAAIVLITAFVRVLVESAPQLIAAGFTLLLAFMQGIADNVGQVVTLGVEIIVNFLGALASQAPRLVAAGASALVSFLGGIASQLPSMITSAATVIVRFLQGITQNMPRVIRAGADAIVSFLRGIAQNIGQLVTAGADVIVRFLRGIANNIGRISRAATDMIDAFFRAAVRAALDLVDAGARAVINFINGVASAIRKYSPELGRAGANLGSAIIQGAISGMAAYGQQLVNQALSIFNAIPGAVRRFLGISSPSRVFMEIGGFMMQGVMVGINQDAPRVNQSIRSASQDMVDTMRDSLSDVPHLLDGLMDTDPVITPVLDLSSVEAEAKKLGKMTNVVPITAAASYNQASSISAEQEAARTTQDEPTKTPPEIKFEQNNYSPEALSTLEVYRRTKNQLAQAKDALGAV